MGKLCNLDIIVNTHLETFSLDKSFLFLGCFRSGLFRGVNQMKKSRMRILKMSKSHKCGVKTCYI